MLNSLFEFSLRNRCLVLVFVGLIIAAGVYAMRKLPIDAVPDVTPNQVQILTDSPGLGPVEVEKFITFPVETALSGLPGITLIRSVSRFGLSAVTVYFEEGKANTEELVRRFDKGMFPKGAATLHVQARDLDITQHFTVQ